MFKSYTMMTRSDYCFVLGVAAEVFSTDWSRSIARCRIRTFSGAGDVLGFARSTFG